MVLSACSINSTKSYTKIHFLEKIRYFILAFASLRSFRSCECVSVCGSNCSNGEYYIFTLDIIHSNGIHVVCWSVRSRYLSYALRRKGRKVKPEMVARGGTCGNRMFAMDIRFASHLQHTHTHTFELEWFCDAHGMNSRSGRGSDVEEVHSQLLAMAMSIGREVGVWVRSYIARQLLLVRSFVAHHVHNVCVRTGLWRYFKTEINRTRYIVNVVCCVEQQQQQFRHPLRAICTVIICILYLLCRAPDTMSCTLDSLTRTHSCADGRPAIVMYA